MGLFNKSRKLERYTNSNGDVVYGPSVHMVKIYPGNKKELNNEISSLKRNLNDIQRQMTAVNRGITSSKRSYDTSSAANARVKDYSSLLKERKKIIYSLAQLGVNVIPESLSGTKIEYRESAEEGGIKMYTDEQINQMRLSVYEAAEDGSISENLKNYLLLTIESTIEDYNTYVNNQAKYDLWEEEARENYKTAKLHLYESFDEGYINEDQLCTMIESLGDEDSYVDKEVASKKEKDLEADTNKEAEVSDDITEESARELVASLTELYIEACKDGDEGAKCKIKKDIEKIKSKVKGGAKVTGEKLSDVKEKLKDAAKKLSKKDKDQLKMIKNRESGGTADDSDDLKDEKPILDDKTAKETKESAAPIDFEGCISNKKLSEFGEEALTTEAYANLTDFEKERMKSFFESLQ